MGFIKSLLDYDKLAKENIELREALERATAAYQDTKKQLDTLVSQIQEVARRREPEKKQETRPYRPVGRGWQTYSRGLEDKVAKMGNAAVKKMRDAGLYAGDTNG